MGDFGVPKKVEYDKEAVLPDSIMLAIKIIERLLTQSKFHEQHVAYRNYPNVQLEKGKADDDDEEEGKKKGGLGEKIMKIAFLGLLQQAIYSLKRIL